MRSLMLLLGAIIIVLLLAATASALQTFRSASTTENHGAVTTTAAHTTANLTLIQDLFMDRTSEVTSISSNLTSDVPLVSKWTSSTNALYVTGLTAGATRTLTVIYKYGNLADYYAADLASRVIITFLLLGVFGLVAGAVYQATRRE